MFEQAEVVAGVVALVVSPLLIVPQLTRLWRLRTVEGVSLLWLLAGTVSASIWAVYLFAQGSPLLAVASASQATLVGLTVFAWFRAAHRRFSWLFLLMLLYIVALLGVAAVLGLAAMVIVVTVFSLFRGIPAVWRVYRDDSIAGVAVGTWLLQLLMVLSWGYYGLFNRDGPLILWASFNLVTVCAILARYCWVRWGTYRARDPVQ